jgi:hypothetical protein
MRRLAVLLFCPFLGGCLVIGYPSITHTPTIEVDEPDVHAFRLVTDAEQHGPFITGPITFEKTTEMLSATNTTISPLSDSYFAYSYMAFPLRGWHDRSMQIRLYRRGYETVSIPAASWLSFPDPVAKPQWKKAANLAACEKAIEMIGGSTTDTWPLSPEVRQFVAQEYRWLAQSEWTLGQEKVKERQRLLDKANHFSSLRANK